MTPERWGQVAELLHDALDCMPAERAHFLDTACAGDAELRREVESLLRYHTGGEHYLDRPPTGLIAEALVQDRTESQAGRTLGYYRIYSRLGEGGMGEVYLAQDTREANLQRKVALKLLRRRLTEDPRQVQRFKQEAHAASALNHPNIITVFEIGKVEDRYFIATEFVEGQTLEQRMAVGLMDLHEVLDIGIQLASALVAAHAAGIVHRDIKPANIMLRHDGYVKILDFGVAKLMERPAAEVGSESRETVSGAWTEPGLGVIGTPRYMSPEQAMAQDLDGRSDIFSLGVVLCELATGKRSFDGSKPAVATDTALGGGTLAPEGRVSHHRTELEHIIGKAMAMDRNERHQSADDLLNDLRGLRLELPSAGRDTAGADRELQDRTPRPGPLSAKPRVRKAAVLAVLAVLLAVGAIRVFWPELIGRSSQSAQDPPSIAVLPFVDMSPEKNQEYLSDGLADELLNRLATVPELRVTGRTSAFQFKNKNEDLRVIGKKLNVNVILEGSIRKVGTRARISVQLIKAADGYQLWSQTFDRDLTYILDVEEEIAREIKRSLKLTLLRGKVTGSPAKVASAEAYDANLQGRYNLSRNKAKLERAIGYFEEAIRLDSGYAFAWVGLGEARVAQAESGYVPVIEGFRGAQEAIERALALDPDLPQAHVAMGTILMSHRWDWAGAEASYLRAQAVTPGHARVTRGMGSLAAITGRLDEAIADYQRAIEIDPFHAVSYYNLALYLHYAGRQEEAMARLKKAVEIAPEMGGAHLLLARIHLSQSNPQEALAEAEKETNPTFRVQGLALAYYRLGRKKEADESLAELIRKFQVDAPFQIAEVYAFRGERDLVFLWLERAYNARDPGLTQIKGDPLMTGLEIDPRYTVLLGRMHLPSRAAVLR